MMAYRVPATQEALLVASPSNPVKTLSLKKKKKTSKMAHQVKVFNTKSNDPSLIPRTHIVGGENQLQNIVL